MSDHLKRCPVVRNMADSEQCFGCDLCDDQVAAAAIGSVFPDPAISDSCKQNLFMVPRKKSIFNPEFYTDKYRDPIIKEIATTVLEKIEA